MNAEQFLRDELARVRAERAALQARLQRYDVLVPYLEQQLARLQPAPDAEVNLDRRTLRTRRREGPSLRTIVADFLAEPRRFTSRDLIAAVQQVVPGAKPDSIRAELSHTATRGGVRRLPGGIYETIVTEGEAG